MWRADRILVIACGDSYHAAQVAQAWLEQIAGIPVELELSWELAARRAILREGVVPLVVSSSETDADALSALRYLKKRETPAVALVHGNSRAVAQEAAVVLDCKHADLGTASTAALPSQLCALAAATIAARHLRDGSGVGDGLPASIADVPHAMAAALELDEACAEIGRRIADAGRGVFVGRGMGRPLASLGARRVEALSGFRAEGFGGGEIKYRPALAHPAGIRPPSCSRPDQRQRCARQLSDARHVIAGGGEPWLIGATPAPRSRRPARGAALHHRRPCRPDVGAVRAVRFRFSSSRGMQLARGSRAPNQGLRSVRQVTKALAAGQTSSPEGLTQRRSNVSSVLQIETTRHSSLQFGTPRRRLSGRALGPTSGPAALDEE